MTNSIDWKGENTYLKIERQLLVDNFKIDNF